MAKETVKIDGVYVNANDGRLTYQLPHSFDGLALDNWKCKNARQLTEMKLRSKGIKTEVYESK